MITYEEKVVLHEAQNQRLTMQMKLSNDTEFVEFEVVLNEIPVDIAFGERTAEEYTNETDF